MIDAPVKQLRDWLEDAETGVNAQILAMPVTAEGDRPLIVHRIYAETDHAWVARVFQGQALDRKVTHEGPILLVGAGGEVDGELRLDRNAGRMSVDVAIRYGAQNDRSDQLVREARQTFRACLRAVAEQFKVQPDREVLRSGDGVGMEQPTNWRLVPLVGEETDDVTYGALVLTIPVTDPWSLALV